MDFPIKTNKMVSYRISSPVDKIYMDRYVSLVLITFWPYPSSPYVSTFPIQCIKYPFDKIMNLVYIKEEN